MLLPQILPGILGRRALPAGRLTRLGATPAIHHGLLGRRAPRTTAARIGSGNAEVSNSRRSAREKARNLEKLANLLTDDTRMPEPIIV